MLKRRIELAFFVVILAGATAVLAQAPAGYPPSPSVDAPEISRSVGEVGGVVLLWPRIIPADAVPQTRELAAVVQERLRGLVEQALPGRAIDVRPEPERVCPQAGCDAMTVGVLLTRRQGGCAAVVLVSAPGRAPARLVPWAGAVRLTENLLAFREPPEDVVTVADYAPCDRFAEWLAYGEGPVVEAIREVGGGSDAEPMD